MARDHARIKVSIWNDPDWRRLSVAAQHAYLLTVSHPSLSYCGLLDYLPGRLAAMSDGQSPAKVRTAFKELESARFVVTDVETEELLVRTYVRHDGVLDRVNMGKAMGRALTNVVSMDLRTTVLRELARLRKESPSLAGWAGFKSQDPETFALMTSMQLRVAS